MHNDDEVQNAKPVGYKNPPKETQFKPHQSGNPSGRPRKKVNNFERMWVEALEQPIVVTKDGNLVEVSYLEVVIHSIMAKAAKGDPKATKMVFDQVEAIRQNADKRSSAIFCNSLAEVEKETEKYYPKETESDLSESSE
jgi:hypothetical protein